MKVLVWNGLNKRKMIRKPKPSKETIEKLNKLEKYSKISKILTKNKILDSLESKSIYATIPNNHTVYLNEVLDDGTIKEMSLASEPISVTDGYEMLTFYSGVPGDNVYEIWNIKTHENKHTVIMNSNMYKKMINVYRRYVALDNVWRDVKNIINK